MARLLGSVEARLDTDFAILAATQGRVERPDAWCFANSVPGAIGFTAGTKYADVAVRLERWNAAPPVDLADWEDRDELPFEELPGAGPLQVAGFELADAPGLDIAGLGRARVRVQATGRHRYGYGDPFDEGTVDEPERWLLQLWPDPERRDGLVGEPRRLAGPPFLIAKLRGAGWLAALHAWEQAGWSALLTGDSFRGIELALQQAGRPVPLDQLPAMAARAGRLATDGQPSMQMPLRSPVSGRSPGLLDAALGTHITTFGDLVTAMLRLGLLTRTEQGAVGPNSAPPAAWDALDLPEKLEGQLRLQALQADYREVQWDLFHLLLWAPDQHLRARPRQIAIRLSVPTDQVIGGLQLLEAHGRIVTDPDLTTLTPDDFVEVSRPHR